jgi:peroxiredoxin
MGKKNTIFTLTLIFLSIIFILGFALYRCMLVNKRLKAEMPSLTVGEKINYFDLNGVDENKVDIIAFRNSQPSLIFIFSRPCSPCNKNIPYWEKISELINGQVSIYGIILTDLTEAYNFADDAKLNFKIYVPEDIKKFAEHFRIKSNEARTIVYDGRVRLIKLGDLDGEAAVSIIKLARSLI